MQTAVVTAKADDEKIYAYIVEVVQNKSDHQAQHHILLQGGPGDAFWGFQSALESVYRKTQELLGQQLKLVQPLSPEKGNGGCVG